MTQDEAKELLTRLLWCAQKLRSNMMESMGVEDWKEDSVDMKILNELHPRIFNSNPSRINLVEALMMYSNGAEMRGVERGDLYNALALCHMEPAMELMYGLTNEGKEIPEAMFAFTLETISEKQD